MSNNSKLNSDLSQTLTSNSGGNPNPNSSQNQNLHLVYQTIYIELLILQSNLLKGIVDVAIDNVSNDLSLILEDLSYKLFEISSLLERVGGRKTLIWVKKVKW